MNHVFLTYLTIMLKTKDAWTLFQRHPSNLLPSSRFFSPHSSASLYPSPLNSSSLTYLTLFTLSILIDFKAILIRT